MKIITIIGARPQFIKASPVSKSLKHAGIEEIIVNTGQHYDYNLSDIFFKNLNIPKAKYNLNVGSQTHGKQTGTIISKLDNILIHENPHAVLLYGDTNSTLGGAVSASKLNIPIIHIEAGLRSFNKQMPEEINRIITDHVSSLLFCPSSYSKTLLKKEGIIEGVFISGDVMFDIFNSNEHLIKPIQSNEDFALLTMHRAENTTIDNLNIRFNQLAKLDIKIKYPIHPRTKNIIEINKIVIPSNIKILDPLGYHELMNVASASKFIVTDSGGLQKEALWLKKYCITIRQETEWVETIEQGINQIVKLTDSINLNWKNKDFKNPYGDGSASKKIVLLIQDFFK